MMRTHINRVALLPLCGLGMLGLAALPAYSQSLALNGAATANISGAGTATTGAHTFGGGAGSATSSYFFVNAYNTSKVTVGSGASITNLNGYDSSSITVTGGSITNLTTSGGPLSISGGTLGTVNDTSDSGVSVTGGSFNSLTIYGINASVSGGNFNSLTNRGFSEDTFKITGGSFNLLSLGGNNLITGGDIAAFEVGGAVNVLGTNLALSPVAGTRDGILTGTLQDGEAIDARVSNFGSGLTLNGVVPVPEASMTVNFGLLLALGLGGLVIAARRKSRGGKAEA